MSKLSKIQKIVVSLIVLISAVFINASIVQAATITFSDYWSLYRSNKYYCIEHQCGFTGGTYKSASSRTVSSDSTEQYDRALAYLLYNGEKTGQGGYNGRQVTKGVDAEHTYTGGKYQYAIWYWYKIHPPKTNTKWGTLPVYKEGEELYNTAMSAVRTPTPYSNDSATIRTASSTITMKGEKGYINVKGISGTVDRIDVEWKDPATNRTYSKTISSGSSKSEDGWMELYSDKERTRELKVNNIGTGIVYLKNVKEDYLVTKVSMHVSSRASGYSVTVTRWTRDDNNRNLQDIISASVQEGRDAERTKEFSVEYAYGSLQLEKLGTYENDAGQTKTERVNATFKIYCLNTGKWVSGTASGNKTEVDSINKATEYRSGVTVSNLVAGYKYEIVEVSVDDPYYNNPIKMTAATSKANNQSEVNVKVTKNGEYYAATGVVVYSATTNKVTIKDKKTAGDVTVVKVDQDHQNIPIQGVKFKIYLKDTGWVVRGADGKFSYNGKKDDATEFETDRNGKIELKCLRNGTYHVYEVDAPEDYDITGQAGYMNKNGKDPYEYSRVNKWVYLGKLKVDSNPIKYTLTNKIQVGDLTIHKVDQQRPEKGIKGVKVKLYLEGKGWVIEKSEGKYDYTGTERTATEFETDGSGYKTIKKLHNGKYHVYEVAAPIDYDLADQPGYMNNNGKDPYEYSRRNQWVYLGSTTINSEDITYNITNKRSKIKLEGDVWVEQPDGKLNATDNVYTSGRDTLLSGIEVNLYDKNGNRIAGPTSTNSSGHYEFTEIDYYVVEEGAYVEFTYDNTKYVSISTLVGNDETINSKAKEYDMSIDELEDEKLTGTSGSLPGKAITEKKEKFLTQYYKENTNRTISHINLGLLEKRDPEYAISENLEYVKITMKGYTYTYKYGDPEVTNSQYVPTVNEQNSKKTFTAAIYPTDIAYNEHNNTDELKVYVVYSIGVKNTETTYADDNYVEEKLYLNSLTNTFDTARYELCTDRNNEDSTDFALWRSEGDGKASYDVNNSASPYKDGMEKNEIKTSYIQFRMKDSMVRTILTKTLTESDVENVPTTAIANGYHEYLRTDNLWSDGGATAFSGVKGTHPSSNSAGKKYYVHKSVSKDAKSSDLFIRFNLSDSRKLSGTVFEDTRTSESTAANTNVGNGILDSDETNRAKSVKVELLDEDKQTVSDLYQIDGRKVKYDENGNLLKATTTTDDNGNFTLDGVVPGYYYIRFTYSDGTQRMMPADEVLKAKDYKSTIINTSNNNSIKNAMEAATSEEARNLSGWYKSLGNTKYSTAVDDLTQRSALDGYEYRADGKVYDSNGNEVSADITINAYTPMVGISIENDINNVTADNAGTAHANEFDEFNFGLIKQADTIVTVDKKITNVKFTNQVGSTLVSANPTDRTAAYITALDNIVGGSKYSKIEVDANSIYGSDLETTYEIVIKNESVKDYVGENYYKYGTDGTTLKQVTVKELQDALDEKYNYNSLPTQTTTTKTSAQITLEPKTETVTNPDGSTETRQYVSMKGWESLVSEEQTGISYTVTGLVSTANDDTAYDNDAQVTSISLDKLTTLKSNFEWNEDATTITITPTTGEDRSNIYWTAAAVAFAIVASGIILIKKKVI